MRRHRPINVWPAFSDLMTVLTIVGLFTAIGLFPYFTKNREVVERIRLMERQQEVARAQSREKDDTIQKLENQLQEAVFNQQMFSAIQEAQIIIDEFSAGSNLKFNADQSLQFGDDLVTFEINGLEPIWSEHGRDRLWQFCSELSSQMERPIADLGKLRNLLTVQVEGHTDSTRCPNDPNCNWRFSSGRAAAFVTFMRDPEHCPGGNEWELRSIGFADKRPLIIAGKKEPTRRIAVRLVPNYRAIIEARNRNLPAR